MIVQVGRDGLPHSGMVAAERTARGIPRNRNSYQYAELSAGGGWWLALGLLDRLPDVLPGNIVCRALDEDSGRVDPARDAWQRQTHTLVYEAVG